LPYIPKIAAGTQKREKSLAFTAGSAKIKEKAAFAEAGAETGAAAQ